MNKKELIANIQIDIDNDVYKNFEKLKNRLQYIANKLARSLYVVNSDDLSHSEVMTLIENSYLDRSFEYTDPSKIFK